MLTVVILGVPRAGRAQTVPLPPSASDTVKLKTKRDTTKVDSVTFKAAPEPVKKDTIKTPLARGYVPANLEIAGRSEEHTSELQSH